MENKGGDPPAMKQPTDSDTRSLVSPAPRGAEPVDVGGLEAGVEGLFLCCRRDVLWIKESGG